MDAPDSRTDPRSRLARLLASALAEEPRYRIESSDIVTDDLAAYLGYHFALYHALTADVVKKRAFERALVTAARTDGRLVEVPSSQTNPGHDVSIDGVTFSLKTEASRAISTTGVTISKLMESAWTKALRSEKDALIGLERILVHLDRYDRVLMLRVFRNADSTRYELLEIPKSVIMSMKDLSILDFTPITPAGSTKAVVRCADQTAFTLVFDGSDNKITIRNLRVALCRLHATWWINGPRDD